ncbi:MAG TPA: response regulator [Nitrospiraceae bacterium]|nr:response regulator [Nitrospiraceae bacterium]
MVDLPHSSPRPPTTVLLVDDDPSTLLICRKILEAEGFIVLQAAGSSEALKLQADHHAPIGLVVTDIMLPPPGFQLSTAGNPYPRVNGRELAELLLRAKGELRIIFMSTSSKEQLLAGEMIPADAPFLKKPFGTEAFRDMIHKVLAGPPATKQLKNRGPASSKDIDWFG